MNIIFDVDGTLWDSTDVVANSWNDAILAKTGQHANLDGARLKQLFGKTMEEIGRLMLPNLDDEKRAEVCQACYDYEDELLAKEAGTFYAGVKDTLETLAKSNDLYVVSNCQVGYIDTVLKHLGMLDKFKGFLCYGDTNLPKGETIKILMKQHNITDAIYVGDTQGDFDACHVAGIPMIFCAYGFGKVENPDYTISDIKELPALIAKLDK